VPPAIGVMMHNTTILAAATKMIANDEDLPNIGVETTPLDHIVHLLHVSLHAIEPGNEKHSMIKCISKAK